MKNRLRPLFVSLIVIGSAAIAQAATYNWNGLATGGATGVSETWDTVTANWTGAGTIWPVSGSDNDAVFGGTAANRDASAEPVSRLTTSPSTPPDTPSQAARLSTQQHHVAPTITTAASVNAEISAIVGGLAPLIAAGLNKAGAGTLTLSGNQHIHRLGHQPPAGTLKITKASAINSIGIQHDYRLC